MASFITGVMVYCALIICVIGLLNQILLWKRTPKNKVPLYVFPRKKEKDIFGTLFDVLFMPEVYQINKPMWIVALYMHLFAPVVLLSHLKLIPGVSTGFFENDIVQLSMGILSIGLILCVGYLLVTKFSWPYKVICVPEDYLLMGTLLAVVGSGAYLGFMGNISLVAYQEYVHGLLLLQPMLPVSIIESGNLFAFCVHIFLVNIAILYFPFSKLLYWFLGSLYTGSLRRG